MINVVELKGKKLFVVVNSDNYVIDCWCAETLEEAQLDNPKDTIIEVTLKNSPFTIGEKYVRKG